MPQRSASLKPIPPPPRKETDPLQPLQKLADLDRVDPDDVEGLLGEFSNVRPVHPPPAVLPCANVQPARYSACEKPGTKACSACKLVSYCSKECQTADWKNHKTVCKNFMRSSDWQPSWVIERRTPSFMGPTDEDVKSFSNLGDLGFNGGSSLWGNMPAIDLINLSVNEADAQKDFSLAFVDENLAADIALHFWYSAFMPAEYRLQILGCVSAFLKHFVDPASQEKPYPLGATSNFEIPWLSEQHRKCLLHYMFDPDSPHSAGIAIDDAQAEYDRVRMAPERRDYRDRMYTNLKPSHRVAFYAFRRYGIVLPLGAANAHFNCANSSLFSLEGKWLQTDYADPLSGWDTEEVVQSGKAHGAQAEDIYGCLYFFLSTNLRTLTQRIRKFPISFKLFSVEACALSKEIKKNTFDKMGISSNTTFDRVEVSNILDVNYVGIRNVLTAWSPLLGQDKHAAIVGYFMNWVMVQKDGRVQGSGESGMKQATKKLLERKGADGLKATIAQSSSDIRNIGA
ncbi:hypothetical protein H1R20_g12763, partial [Candolleomyces eurysporus]